MTASTPSPFHPGEQAVQERPPAPVQSLDFDIAPNDPFLTYCLSINGVVELERHEPRPLRSLDDVLRADAWARRTALDEIGART